MLNTIAQIRMPNGEVVDMVDWTDLPLYSSVDLQTGFTGQDISLFQYVEGDTVPGLGTAAITARTATARDTNMSAPGSMATTEEMLVYAIKPEFYLFAGTPNDFTSRVILGGAALPGMPMVTLSALAVFQQRLLLELDISEKAYAKASIGYFNTGFGPYGQGQTAPTLAAAGASRNLGTNGNPSQSAVRSFVVPHHIGSQEKFRVNLLNPGGNAVNFGVNEASPPTEDEEVQATIIINLDGLYKRPVS